MYSRFVLNCASATLLNSAKWMWFQHQLKQHILSTFEYVSDAFDVKECDKMSQNIKNVAFKVLVDNGVHLTLGFSVH